MARQEFWVTNFSLRNVTLADLAINIKTFSTVNLLDKRHYHLTIEQLTASMTSGSLFKKRNKLIIRQSAPPPVIPDKIPMLMQTVIPSRGTSVLEIEHKEYDELKIANEKELQKISDEQFAAESLDSE